MSEVRVPKENTKTVLKTDFETFDHHKEQVIVY